MQAIQLIVHLNFHCSRKIVLQVQIQTGVGLVHDM